MEDPFTLETVTVQVLSVLGTLLVMTTPVDEPVHIVLLLRVAVGVVLTVAVKVKGGLSQPLLVR